MAKLKTRYVCQACGSEQHRWQGQCPDCAEWNTLIQESAAPTVFSAKHDLSSGGRAVELVGLDAVVALPDRMRTGIEEFVVDGTDGLLVADDAEMTEAIVHLVRDERLLAGIRSHNHAVRPAFGWDRVLRAAESEYRRAAALAGK